MAVGRQRTAGGKGHDQRLTEEAGGRGEAAGVRIALLSERPVGGLERGVPGVGDMGEAADIGAAHRTAGEGGRRGGREQHRGEQAEGEAARHGVAP